MRPRSGYRHSEDVTLDSLTIGPTRGTAVRVEGGKNVTIAGCTIQSTGQTGVVFTRGSDHRLQSCQILNTGEGGSVVRAGDRATLTLPPPLWTVMESEGARL